MFVERFCGEIYLLKTCRPPVAVTPTKEKSVSNVIESNLCISVKSIAAAVERSRNCVHRFFAK